MDAFEAADVVTDNEWERIMCTNLTVPTRMIRAVLPFMKAKKNGSIVNVASKAAISGSVAGIAYTTSKHGLVSLNISYLENERDEEDGMEDRLNEADENIIAWCDKTYCLEIS